MNRMNKGATQMRIKETINQNDPALRDIVARTRRAEYRAKGIHPDWVARFRRMGADRVLAILLAQSPVIVVPG